MMACQSQRDKRKDERNRDERTKDSGTEQTKKLDKWHIHAGTEGESENNAANMAQKEVITWADIVKEKK